MLNNFLGSLVELNFEMQVNSGNFGISKSESAIIDEYISFLCVSVGKCPVRWKRCNALIFASIGN